MINKESFLVRYKDLPTSGISPYIPQSYEAIDKTWALELHSQSKLVYGNLVGSVEGRSLTFMKGVDTSKDLYLIECQVQKGSMPKIDGKLVAIHGGAMKLMVGNLPTSGIPATTEESSKALVDKFIAVRKLAEANTDKTGFVDMAPDGTLSFKEVAALVA